MTERPRLEACYFGDGAHGAMYVRLAQVLDYTAHEHCQGWNIRVDQLKPPVYHSSMGNQSHVWNTQKLEHWRDRLLAAPDGAHVLLIDADMMILRALDDVWSLDFDIAYTRREASRLPLNGGVVFVRVSSRTRAFMRDWWAKNCEFLHDAQKHHRWRMKYAGINQSSLGYLLEQGDHGCQIVALGCGEWNCCEWQRTFRPEVTRIVHIKSGLRRTVFKLAARYRRDRTIQRLVGLWLAKEQEAEQWRTRQAGTNASTDIEATR